MIGIIGAMADEVAKLKAVMLQPKVTAVAGMEFYKGTIYGKEVVVVRSGIGKVNAAICTQILADRFQADKVINTGIAGSLKSEINIGDLVLSTDALQHDLDAAVFGYQLGEIPQMKTSIFQTDQKLLQLAKRCCEQVNPEAGIHCGRVVSGDQFVASKEKKQWLADNFHGLCTEMEGAAIAQAAFLNDIDFLIVRAISDKADDSADMDYPAFEKMAIERSLKLLLAMISEL